MGVISGPSDYQSGGRSLYLLGGGWIPWLLVMLKLLWVFFQLGVSKVFSFDFEVSEIFKKIVLKFFIYFIQIIKLKFTVNLLNEVKKTNLQLLWQQLSHRFDQCFKLGPKKVVLYI